MGMATFSDYGSGGTASGHIWNVWASSTANYRTMSSTASDGVWDTWTSDNVTCIRDVTTSVASKTKYVWLQWVDGSEESEKANVVLEERYRLQREEWERQREEHKLQDEKWKKQRKEAKRRRELAESKAKELLEIFIGKKEMKVYEETGRIFVKGKEADYHIVKGDGFNIRKIEKERVTDLCVHLENKNSMPETDNVVALLLNLKADEEAVLNLANDHGRSEDRFDNLPLAANG